MKIKFEINNTPIPLSHFDLKHSEGVYIPNDEPRSRIIIFKEAGVSVGLYIDADGDAGPFVEDDWAGVNFTRTNEKLSISLT